MLKSLSIRNFILIDKLDWDLHNGFSVLSGETGAGKSILLDALGLALGKRADVAMIRANCDKISVCATFEVADKSGLFHNLCQEYDLDFEREILITRSLDKNGHGKIFFNDRPITQKLLKEIGSYLVEVHGQFDNQGLLNEATHLDVLDGYGIANEVLSDVHQSYSAYKKARQAREDAEKQISEARSEEESLRHWVQELAALKPKANEQEELEQKRRQLMNAEKISENLAAAFQVLQGTGAGVQSALRQAQSAVSRVNALSDDKYAAIYEALDTALINVAEAEQEIEDASQEINLSQNEINQVEERLFALKDVARKHQVSIDELPEVLQNMEQKLLNLAHGEDSLETLKKNEARAKDDYLRKAKILHEERVAAAQKLDAKVMAELPALKMEKARFQTQICLKNEDLWNEKGGDEVRFLVSTNPGTPFGPLSKIASGGELARFMLALKVNLAQSSQVETMIFDEVDAGIGGATAQAVGAKLAKLGETLQVLVVTHSPQVAAHGSYHYKVEKIAGEKQTTMGLHALSAAQKNEEIARMISGAVITDEARAAAKVLIGD